MKKIANCRVSMMLIAIFIILTAVPVFSPAGEVKGQATPDVTVNVDPSIIKIDVSPRGTGVATTVATVKNTGVHTVTVDVDIVAQGYDVSPAHRTVTLIAGGTQTITIGISVLLRSPYRITTGTVTATVTHVDNVPVSGANWQNSDGFTVTTMPYAYLILDAKDPMVKVWPGKSYEIKMNVENYGNAEDEVRLQINNRDELARDGFATALSSSGSMPIAPGENRVMSVHIQTPKKIWKNQYYSVDIRAISSIDPDRQFDYSVTIWVWGMYVPGFDPVPAMIAFAVMAVFLTRKRED